MCIACYYHFINTKKFNFVYTVKIHSQTGDSDRWVVFAKTEDQQVLINLAVKRLPSVHIVTT